MLAELIDGEKLVGHRIQPPTSVGKVPVIKARIKPFGQANKLIHRVMLQGGRDIDVIARFSAIKERHQFPPSQVIKIENRPYVHSHRPAGPVEVGNLQHGLLPAGSSNNPFSETFACPIEDILELTHTVQALGHETRIEQGAFH